MRRSILPLIYAWNLLLSVTIIPCISFPIRTINCRAFHRRATIEMKTIRYDDSGDDYDNDDDDDDFIDDKQLGDWRKFRSTLVDGGHNFDEIEEDGYVVETKAKAPKTSAPKKEISIQNLDLLEQQSSVLAEEYKNGIWAHEASVPETGGLVIRLPFEIEIGRNYLNMDKSTNHSAVEYEEAQSLIETKMKSIAKYANEGGEINPTKLPSQLELFLSSYIDYQQNWQEVCLVAELDEKSGTAKTFTLNRPMAFKLREDLAKLILFGAQVIAITGGRTPPSRRNLEEKFIKAFRNNCGIYMGGPDLQDQPATIIHGISDSDVNATEISPGTGLFVGGNLDLILDRILNKTYDPLDFRFFVGCHFYKKFALDVAIRTNKYQPVASARAVALKQCIQLPKPLWNEIMELCGGLLSKISKLELQKRNDLT